ncbi:piggyBac transposable element-derived protein 4-like, partial [Acyrthosiphon pisum]|uniref:PiggyBac transposable element-derived protein domain-containing protein n=1 Tax=Acyrthosiphon pisum TaxID=7029 RepID=A0A8R2NUK7_ACYPI
MNRNEISSLLDLSSESSFDDTDEDPNWNDEDVYSSSEDESSASPVMRGDGNDWNNVIDEQPNSNVIYNPNNECVGINEDIVETMIDCSPYDFFALFFDDEVLKLIVLETNRYANDKRNSCNLSRNARIKKWKETDVKEIKTFFGLVIWMGLDKMPTIGHYWRNTTLFSSHIPQYMSKNRFELLLSVLHFSDNNTATSYNRLYKIQPLIDLLVYKFNAALIPNDSMCIDESMVPFSGRLLFRQYNASKRHRYGIKIFKLCTTDFYTSKYKIYSGKEASDNTSVATKVVFELLSDYLDFGRTLYADNWYNSIDLAEKLLDRNTHLVGTLRKNRKRIPKEIVTTKLKRGEMIAKQNGLGVTVLKWKDRRDVLMISTKHGLIDVSDQIGAYHTCLRKGVKWYRKVAFDIICNTAVVNAFSLYKAVTNNNKSITQFREDIALDMVKKKEVNSQQTSTIIPHHTLVKDKKRARCDGCYRQCCREEGTINARKKAKRVHTKCEAILEASKGDAKVAAACGDISVTSMWKLTNGQQVAKVRVPRSAKPTE